MFVALALAVLALGGGVSLLTMSYPLVALRIGLPAAGAASVLCIIGGSETLVRAPTAAAGAVDWPLPLGSIRIELDGLSAWFLVVIGAVGTGTAVYSWSYFRESDGRGPVGAFGPLVCTMIAAMVLVVCATDAVVFLFGWELMSLSAFFLVGFHDHDAEARRGAWTYLIASHLGTALGVLPVFAAFVARSGGTAMGGFPGVFASTEAGWCMAMFVLGLVGFGTKAGFIPFHVWLPAAHPVAPSPVSALMSGVVIKTGIYGLLRLLSWLPVLPLGCAVLLMSVSVATGVMGILYALGQRQVKRMLAYSSIENIGIIGMAISVALLGRSMQEPVLVICGLGGALLHVLNHALFKGLLFLSAGAAMHDTGTGDMERMGGLAPSTPANAAAFLFGSVAICALPPLNGFVGEFLIYAGILQGVMRLPSSYGAFLAGSAMALALIGGLSLVTFSKAFSVMFLGMPRDRSIEAHATPASMIVGMLLLGLGCAVVAATPGGFIAPISVALSSLVAEGETPPAALGESITLIARISTPIGVFLAAAAMLFVLRRLFVRATDGGRVGTWGCGFMFPSATMQYTASSYAWKAIYSFRHVLQPGRSVSAVTGCFPSPGRLATVTADAAEERIYRPMFMGLARTFERLWPLQHGRIQLYLVYIAATALIIFLVEGFSAPFGGHTNGGAANSTTQSPTPAWRAETDQEGSTVGPDSGSPLGVESPP